MQVLAIQTVEGVLHVRVCGKFHHTFIPPVLVSVGIGDLPSLPHEVLEVLPIKHSISTSHGGSRGSECRWQPACAASPPAWLGRWEQPGGARVLRGWMACHRRAQLLASCTSSSSCSTCQERDIPWCCGCLEEKLLQLLSGHLKLRFAHTSLSVNGKSFVFFLSFIFMEICGPRINILAKMNKTELMRQKMHKENYEIVRESGIVL